MYALQAIPTKYHGATNTKGSRISATSAFGIKIFIGYPHELSGVDCHAKAAEYLARKLGWLGEDTGFASKFVAGGTNTGYVFVQVS